MMCLPIQFVNLMRYIHKICKKRNLLLKILHDLIFDRVVRCQDTIVPFSMNSIFLPESVVIGCLQNEKCTMMKSKPNSNNDKKKTVIRFLNAECCDEMGTLLIYSFTSIYCRADIYYTPHSFHTRFCRAAWVHTHIPAHNWDEPTSYFAYKLSEHDWKFHQIKCCFFVSFHTVNTSCCHCLGFSACYVHNYSIISFIICFRWASEWVRERETNVRATHIQ